MDYFPPVRKRVFEAIIDYSIVWGALFAYVLTFGHPGSEGEIKVEGIEVLPIILFWFVYFPLIEGTTGKTLGKWLMRTHVIKLNGKDINILDSVVRRVFDVVDMMFLGLVGLLVMRNSQEKKRVGDLIAKTMVVEDQNKLCESCGQSLTLDWQDLSNGYFNCPECGHKNIISSSVLGH